MAKDKEIVGPRGQPKEEKKLSVITKIRNSIYIFAFALQGVLSMVYGPLTGMIQLKFVGKDVFTTHGVYFYICAGAFIAMAIGFAAMIYVIIQQENADNNDDTGYPTGIGYRLLSGVVLLCVLIPPTCLTLVLITPHEDKHQHKGLWGLAVPTGVVVILTLSSEIGQLFVWMCNKLKNIDPPALSTN